jgi:predicted ester cyclase
MQATGNLLKGPLMTTDQNVASLNAARAQWNAGNLEGYLALYDPGAVLRGYAGVEPGLHGIRRFYQAFWAAFPGSQLAFEDVIAAGEKVACRFVLQGVHGGAFQGIAATGMPVRLPGVTILEFHDGRCVQRWSDADLVGLLQQLGALPSRSLDEAAHGRP